MLLAPLCARALPPLLRLVGVVHVVLLICFPFGAACFCLLSSTLVIPVSLRTSLGWPIGSLPPFDLSL